MGWEYTIFRRDELYEQVWSEPLTKIAKRYGISDVGLRKICVKLDVPLPAAGHRAKLAAGHSVTKPSLGATEGATTYRRSRYTVPRDETFETRYSKNLEADLQHRPPAQSMPLRTSLDDCLPVIKRVAKKLEGRGRDSRGWQLCDGPGLMWVASSTANCLRATLLLNLLLESLVAAGYKLSAGANAEGRAYVSMLDHKFSFKVRERSRREAILLTREQRQENEKVGFNRHSQQYEYHATGEFDIAATEPDGSYELAKIGDSRSAGVETKVAAFIVRLRELAIRRRVQAEISAERKVIADAKAAEDRRLAEIRRKALDRLKEVEEWAVKLERANRLRSLADKFETEKLASTDGVINAEWIRRAADWLDPTVLRRWDEADGPSDGAAD